MSQFIRCGRCRRKYNLTGYDPDYPSLCRTCAIVTRQQERLREGNK